MSALQFRSWLMGMILGAMKPFVMRPWHEGLHMAVLGASGSGKSKFLELIARYKLMCGHGSLDLDPHSDYADSLMEFVAFREKMGDPLWKRVHFLEFSKHRAFAFDPFARLPIRGTLPRDMYFQALKTVVDRTKRTMLRRYAESDLDIMNRLSRNLDNALTCCGVALDGKNTHIGLHKALAFCDPAHPEFHPLLDRVYDHLPIEVQADMQRLRHTNSEVVKDKWESAINQFRKMLSPILALAFMPGIRPPINMKSIIDKQEYAIARLGQSPDFSHDQKLIIGGLLIDEVLNVREAEEGLAPEDRKPFSLKIDESGEFIGEDLLRASKATRKYGLSITFAAQDLQTLVKGNLDLISAVLSQCQTVVCFQQTYRKDKELLQDRLGTGNMAWTKRFMRRQYQDGYMKIMTTDTSYSKQSSRSDGGGASKTKTDSEQNGQSNGNTSTHTAGSSNAMRQGASEVKDKEGSLQSTNKGQDLVSAKTQSDSRGETSSMSHVEGHSIALGQNVSWSTTVGEGKTISEKTSYLARIRDEFIWDGSYEEGTTADQQEKMMQQIHCLQTAEAIVSLRGERYAFPVKVAMVEDLWPHPKAKHEYTERVKKMVADQHPYTFSPIDVCWAMEQQLPPEAADEPVVIRPEEEEKDEENPLA